MKQRFRDGKKSGWTCLACANARAKAYRVSTPDAHLSNKLWTFYRIRLSDFRRMLDEQKGACAACGRTPKPRANGIAGTGLCIDHDHTCCAGTRQQKRICGRCVRGLICQQCNVALGMVDDSPARLRQLIAYVERHSTSIPFVDAN